MPVCPPACSSRRCRGRPRHRAGPLNKALERIDNADCLLLGPQIAYAKKDAVEAAKGKPVAVIAMTDYGRMNAKKILADAMKLMGE